MAQSAGFVAGGLPAGGSAYLALGTVSVVPVFVGVGAIASQLAPTRRIALELGGALVGLSLVLRVIADTASGAGWLRWATLTSVFRGVLSFGKGPHVLFVREGL